VTDPFRFRPPPYLHPGSNAPTPPGPPPPAPVVIAVCSGKGGVGKSTVALNLAVALGLDGARVGLLDADVHAPDIPLMVGLVRSAPSTGWTLSRARGRADLEPVERYGIKLMSSGFIVAEDQAVTLVAGLAGALLAQLIWSTRWGGLDYLIIDLPPGTSDVVQETFRLLPKAGAVVVVTPQDVAHLDNRRVLTALSMAEATTLGGIENMTAMTCPCCDARLEIFPPVAHERSVWATGLARLGTVPMGVIGPDGAGVTEPVVATAPDSPRGRALREAAAAVRAAADLHTA
jgi:ATP-binding protein involved in chromosome partitioning